MKQQYEHPTLDVELLNTDIICASDETTVMTDDPEAGDNGGANYSNFEDLFKANNFTF
ncbi:hypothetical protein H7U32_05050 [Bifidobacterium pullorum subsp. saeculare]|uniref:Uncharacterized protein n=1 Tax=Bifidobacterium pullorum subsp. saeculare TaxID=78257 RepID=A0A938WXG0_9BIFI|nr:hypothetical protein [Bifidobacterium pullorum]MBM6699691.1 hypothetical protein [Bifidobacterium pullorum subsp. saeculare]